MFSDIVQRFDTPLNALYRERDARLKAGLPVIDLVSGNMTRAGYIFPPEVLSQALAAGARKARIYQPNPLGQPVARAAIQAYYRGEGLKIPAGQIIITPGTSVSYGYLFKLLCNRGDEILCPTPSYPLLNSIADLCGIQLTSYRLREEERWRLDLHHLESQITPKTRAIVVISPHNPTGAVATPSEIQGLGELAAAHRLPIISDEVFSAFLFQTKRLPRPATHPLPLVFTLNGVSKMLALPGLKIGWIAVTGDPALVQKAVHALDMISDTFLPVNEAAQFALPVLLKKGKAFLKRYQHAMRLEANETMRAFASAPGVDFIRPEGGFTLTLRLKNPAADEDKTALALLKGHGLMLHPGYFYDLEGSHLVLSFATPPRVQRPSIKKIVHYLQEMAKN